jgi:hypothetical protein
MGEAVQRTPLPRVWPRNDEYDAFSGVDGMYIISNRVGEQLSNVSTAAASDMPPTMMLMAPEKTDDAHRM